MNLTKKILLGLILGICSTNLINAQIAVPFKMRYQSFIKGDMTIIANNITNRVDYNNSSNVPYYNTSNHALLNDQYYMEYIDIDNDPSTFSSSAASLTLQNQENKKIVYAGLYWSATYKYNSGDIKKQDKYVAIDENREAIDAIKIKLPGNNHYTEVKGEVIFDGLDNKEFKECAPYAAYANITNQILELKNPFGQYTVANIKATQGKISGGVASGWTIFIVYEDPMLSDKFITSFDGFAGVSDHMAEINFSGFKTQSQGAINAKFAFAALEGDNNLTSDKFLFKTSTTDKYTSLSNKLRKENNFLNSSITIDDTHFLNRLPDSKNTLGYDSGIISIQNPNNTVIENNTNQAMLRMQTYGDRNYVFFSAFNIEAIEENKVDVIESSIVSTEIDYKNQKDVSKFAPQKTVESENIETSFAEIVPVKKENNSLSEINSIEDVTDIKYITINNFPSGYYIVANVFAKKYNLENFKKDLSAKGIQATSFFNPENKYNYVYLAKTNDKDEALKLYLNKVNNSYQDHVWILSVNNQPDTRLTDTE